MRSQSRSFRLRRGAARSVGALAASRAAARTRHPGPRGRGKKSLRSHLLSDLCAKIPSRTHIPDPTCGSLKPRRSETGSAFPVIRERTTGWTSPDRDGSDGDRTSRSWRGNPLAIARFKRLADPPGRRAERHYPHNRLTRGSVQSGFNEVALRMARYVGVARSHRSLQIHRLRTNRASSTRRTFRSA
jgi:hypothetical protein